MALFDEYKQDSTIVGTNRAILSALETNKPELEKDYGLHYRSGDMLHSLLAKRKIKLGEWETDLYWKRNSIQHIPVFERGIHPGERDYSGLYQMRLDDSRLALIIENTEIRLYSRDEQALEKALDQLKPDHEGVIYKPLERDFRFVDIRRTEPKEAKRESLTPEQGKVFQEIADFVNTFKEHQIDQKLNIFIHGKPGVGKSFVIRSVVSELGIPAILVPRSALKVSDGIEFIYDLAKTVSPSMVLLEDFDVIAGDRSIRTQSEAFHELLQRLDGVGDYNDDGIITIATTNHPDNVDHALTQRSGRFEMKQKIQQPTVEEMLNLLPNFIPQELEGVSESLARVVREKKVRNLDEIDQLVQKVELYRLKDGEAKDEHIQRALDIVGSDDAKVGYQ